MTNDEYIINKSIYCQECGHGLIEEDKYFKAFFQSEEIKCPECDITLDLWKMIERSFDETLVKFGWHYGSLECKGVFRKITLKPNEIFELDLSKEIGDGELLYINYTPSRGGLSPTQMHGNTPFPNIKPKKIFIYPRPVEKNATETEVQLLYWFAPENVVNDLSIMLLLDAFQRYYDKNYRYMFISAQTSIEILQSEFLEGLLKANGVPGDKTERFLTESVTFSTQLKTFVPFLANIMKFPNWQTNNQIRKGLSILIDKRNDLVHRGKTKYPSDKLTLKALMSAFFVFKYYKSIHGINDSA